MTGKITPGQRKLPSFTLTFDENLVPKGWKIVRNVKPSKFQVKDINLVSVLEKDEESVSGKVMRQRAKNLKANLGLADAKYVLEHQAEIPVEFQEKFLLFPGTLFDCNHIACLVWKDGKWHPAFLPLWYSFDDDDLLVRCKSAGRAQA